MYQCEVTLEEIGKGWMFNSQKLMREIFDKLPHRLKAQFVLDSSHDSSSFFNDLWVLVYW